MIRNVQAVAIAIPVLAFLAAAQETRGTVRGLVADQQGAGVPRAAVQITRIETNTVVRTASNDSGYFEAPLLLPGQYSVTVEAPGFKKSIRSGLELRGGSTIDVNVTLEIGQLAETSP